MRTVSVGLAVLLLRDRFEEYTERLRQNITHDDWRTMYQEWKSKDRVERP